jgi:hypothetical protein
LRQMLRRGASAGNPKGCKESSRWSESAETTGNARLNGVGTPEGCQILRCKDLYVDLDVWHPFGVRS